MKTQHKEKRNKAVEAIECFVQTFLQTCVCVVHLACALAERQQLKRQPVSSLV